MERRILRWTCAALLVVGTLAWSSGREDHGLPTADLHADAPYYYVYLPSLLHGDLDFTDEADTVRTLAFAASGERWAPEMATLHARIAEQLP